MAWNSSVEHNRPIFPRFKPERPHIDIAAAAHSHGGVDPVADNESLRTPIDLPSAHPDTPWYNPAYPFSSYGQLRLPNNLEGLPPDVHYRVTQGLHVYDEFSRPMDVDVAPSLPPRGMLELHDQFDERELEFSPPSPSHRPLSLLEPDSSRYSNSRNNDYRGLPGYGESCDESPSQSPPSPFRRTLQLMPEDWIMDDCPELSPPSPRQGCLGLPSLNDSLHADSLLDYEYYNETPSLRDTLSITSSPQSPPLSLTARLHQEFRELEDLQRRTEQSERVSRARTVKLRTHERTLARAIAERTSQAREINQSDSEAISLGREALGSQNTSLPSLNSSPVSDLTDEAGSNKEIVRFYRTRATRLMLDRIEEKRRRKREKEQLKELRVILGPGTDALLDLAEAADGDGEEAGSDAGGLGLGLTLEQPKARDVAEEAESERQLADRHRAMRRLVAHMTIRRRELERRSLLEAGNLAEAYLKESESNPARGDEMQMDVDTPRPLLRPDLSYLAKRLPKSGSPLKKEVDLFENLEDVQGEAEGVQGRREEIGGLLLGF